MPLEHGDPNHFELPHGGWADLFEGELIPERRRRPVQRRALAMQRALPEQDRASAEVRPAPEGEPDPSMGAPPVGELAEAGTVRVNLKDVSEAGLDAIDAFNDSVIVAFTREWSFGDEVSADALADLPGGAYDALLTECQRRNKGGAVKNDVGSAPESPDGADPTLPSGAS